MTMFDRPIPGQSLTSEPKGQAYERPPETVSPKEALEIHIENLSTEEAIEDITHFISMGLDVKSLTEAILRSAVAEGIHSIDISLIIAPVLHEFIKGRLDALGLEYDEGLDNPKEKENIRYSRRLAEAKKMISDIKPQQEEVDVMSLEDTEIEPTVENVIEETPVREEQPQGLMARMQ
jgi:hypothetical protein